MASVFSKDGYLYLTWYEGPKGEKVKKYSALGIKDTRENWRIAEKEAKQKTLELSLSPVLKSYKYPLRVAVSEFLSLKSGNNKENYKYSFDYLLELYGDMNCQDLTPNDFEKLKVHLQSLEWELKNKEIKKLAHNTISSYFKNYHILFNYLVNNNVVKTNPVPHIKKKKTRNRPAPISELKSVFNYLKGYNLNQYRAAKLLFYTGLRLEELCSLKWTDIDFENDVIYVNNTKGDREDELFPLYPALKEFLSSFKEQSGKVIPYKNKDSFHFWRRAFDKINEKRKEKDEPLIQYCNIHSLRKSFGSELAKLKIPRSHHKDLMRHQKYQTTDEYYTFTELQERGEYAQVALGNLDI